MSKEIKHFIFEVLTLVIGLWIFEKYVNPNPSKNESKV